MSNMSEYSTHDAPTMCTAIERDARKRYLFFRNAGFCPEFKVEEMEVLGEAARRFFSEPNEFLL